MIAYDSKRKRYVSLKSILSAEAGFYNLEHLFLSRCDYS